MLSVAWKYRWGCIRLLLLQAVLLFMTITALRLAGLGIDVIRHYAEPDKAPPPPYPWGLAPPDAWPPLAKVAAIAATILALDLCRGILNYTYVLSSGTLIHTRIVVDLRDRVYDKLQRLSFRSEE